jgi:hypothetical protein
VEDSDAPADRALSSEGSDCKAIEVSETTSPSHLVLLVVDP